MVCACGSLSQNVLHPPWWGTGTGTSAEHSAQGGSCMWQPSASLSRTCAHIQTHAQAHTHTCTHKHTHSRIGNSHVWFWSWSHSFECRSMWHCKKGFVFVSHRKRDHSQRWMFFFIYIWRSISASVCCAYRRSLTWGILKWLDNQRSGNNIHRGRKAYFVTPTSVPITSPCYVFLNFTVHFSPPWLTCLMVSTLKVFNKDSRKIKASLLLISKPVHNPGPRLNPKPLPPELALIAWEWKVIISGNYYAG